MELRMSEKERDRLKVVEQVVAGKLTQSTAAEALEISERQVRRSIKRYRDDGDAGLLHRSRGQPSNRKIPEPVREQALVALRRDDWRDFGPTFAAEKLAEYEDIHVSRETVRQWMLAEDLWQAKSRRVKHRQWRERKECFGAMTQMDTSEEAWLEGRGEDAVLLAMIDDATSRILMRLFPSDDTATNMTLIRDYIRRYGRPRSIYADKASHFKTTRSATTEEQLEGREAETQIERALRELDIKYIVAHSPQAKGRVERSFETAQDRLIKELRLKKIDTIAAANEFIEQKFMPYWNDELAVAPASSADLHRPLNGHDLEAIFSRQETRVVTNNYTIQYKNKRYQIARESIVAGLRKAKVIVEKRLDGTLKVRYKGEYLEFREAPLESKKKAAEAKASGRKRKRGTAVKPAADHPWRKPFKRPSSRRARR